MCWDSSLHPTQGGKLLDIRIICYDACWPCRCRFKRPFHQQAPTSSLRCWKHWHTDGPRYSSLAPKPTADLVDETISVMTANGVGEGRLRVTNKRKRRHSEAGVVRALSGTRGEKHGSFLRMSVVHSLAPSITTITSGGASFQRAGA